MRAIIADEAARGILHKMRQGHALCEGEKAAKGRVEPTNGFIFSGDETADVGVGEATPVVEDYNESDNRFTGKIRKVTVELK